MAQRFPKALLVVWVCFLLRGVFYSALLPLWEGYDEWAHFAYVQHVAYTGRLSVPDLTRPSRGVIESLRLVPLPWTQRHEHADSLPHDDWWRLPPAERAARERRLLDLSAGWRAEDPPAKPNYESQQPPLYYWLMALPLRAVDSLTLPTQVFVLRCLSLALASLAIPLGFLLARRLLGSVTAAIGVLAILALMPEAAINFARVANEAPAMPVYTAMMLLCARLAAGETGRKIWLPLGILLGCGLLTKAYLLTALPAVAVVTLWAAWRNPAVWRRVLAAGAAACLLGIAIGGWWYAFMYSTTGTLTGMIQTVSVRHIGWAERLAALGQVSWTRAFDTLAISHLWFGGWSFLQVRSWMYRVFEWMLAPAAAGLLLLLLGRRDRSAILVPSAFAGAFLCSLAYHVVVGYLEYRLSMTSGWYLYSVTPGLLCLLALGWRRIAPARLWPWVLPSVAACFALLDLYGVHFLLLPYYHGLITHSATGRLGSFSVDRIGAALSELLLRVPVNRPYLPGPAGFAALWLAGVTATAIAVITSFRAAATRRPS